MAVTIDTRPATGDRDREAPLTLGEAPARTLGFLDQFSLWGNLGISLTLPVLAPFLMPAGTSLAATVTAVLVGAVIGSFLLALTAVPGAATGAPAMVVLRGVFGARLSVLPTAFNVIQCVGWAVVEILVIAQAAQSLTSSSLRWVFILLAGCAATALALFPLSFIKRMRRYMVVVVLIASAYLFISTVRHGVGPWSAGNWSNFWPGVDLVVGLAISWAPLAADYSRHSRTRRAAFGGAFAGYTAGATVYLLLGVFALVHMSDKNGDVTGALLHAVPLAAVALAVLAVDEVDEAFANVYSTAMSAQNVAPRLDRRLLAAGIGLTATTVALVVDLRTYQSFLYLIGAVFVPLSAVLVVTFFARGRTVWDTSQSSPPRPALLVPWALGFAVYQLIYPTTISPWPWWVRQWTSLQSALHFTPRPWMSASLSSFAVAALVTCAMVLMLRRRSALRTHSH
jgi:putative hydroxymethylpyrimidine transporter CytX